MTNIYALKYELNGSDGELILNALNQGEAIRKAEQWFARKYPHHVPAFSAKPVASMVICGNEKEIVCQPAASVASGRN
ncbi:MAG: hypothetical protein ABSG69_11730 [Candidatus Acidiferrum sp.]|jgi:hypothetical protein